MFKKLKKYEGGYIGSNGRYAHKDGVTTSKPGLWSNLYLKNKKMALGGYNDCPEGMIWEEISQSCIVDENYKQPNNVPTITQDQLCYDSNGIMIPCEDSQNGMTSADDKGNTFITGITNDKGEKVGGVGAIETPNHNSGNSNKNKNKNLKKQNYYREPNWAGPLAFNSLISGMFNGHNNNINSNNILNTAEYNNPYDNRFTQYNKCGGKVYNKMMKSGGFIKYEDGGDVDETRDELSQERQSDIGLRQQQLNVFFNQNDNSTEQNVENPYIENIDATQSQVNVPSFKPQEISTYENIPFNINKISEAIGQYESGNKFWKFGNTVKSGRYAGERALGKYQIMPGNLPSWSKEALGREVSQKEFMENEELQDAIAQHQMLKIAKKHNNPIDVASIWLSGRPFGKSKAKDVNGTNQTTYVKNVMKYYK